MQLTEKQWQIIMAFGAAISGPVANILVTKFGWTDADVKNWFDIISALTVLIGGVWGTTMLTQSKQVNAVSNMDNVAHVAVKDNANGTLGTLADSGEPAAAKVLREKDVTAK